MKSRMYFPTTRVLTVLELMQSRPNISGPDLAGRLEVDVLTVRRYITMLQDLGIPVEAGRGGYGSYRLRPGFKLPRMRFTDDEALALTLGLLAAREMGLASAAPAVEGALAKIERVLPRSLSQNVQALQETLIFDVVPSSAAIRSEIVSTLSTAAQQQHSVWLHYHSWSDQTSERVLDPYGLVYRSGYWYTVGYCHLREDLRTLRLDRVIDVVMQKETFTRPPDFDSLTAVRHAIPNTPAKWLVDVLLETSLEKAQRRVSPTFAVLEQTSEGVNFRTYVDNLEWAAHILIGLQCPMIIRAPPELRDVLQEMARHIM